MAKYQHFEDLPVWQEAGRLYNQVLDLFERPNLLVSGAFRNQLDRAALSVSNNIAEGFERVTTDQLLAFLSIARGSAGEVRSMIAVVKSRPNLLPHQKELEQIRILAESCARQITAWISSIENSSVTGKRHLNDQERENRRVAMAAKEFRIRFLRALKADHPLYNTSEARLARGETEK